MDQALMFCLQKIVDRTHNAAKSLPPSPLTKVYSQEDHASSKLFHNWNIKHTTTAYYSTKYVLDR